MPSERIQVTVANCCIPPLQDGGITVCHLPIYILSFMLDKIGILTDARHCTNKAYHYRREQSVDVTATVQHEEHWFNSCPTIVYH